MSEPRDPILEQASACHDGERPELRDSADPEVRAAMEKLAQIDAALVELYGTGESEIPSPPEPGVGDAPAPIPFRLARPLALAAALLLTLSAFLYFSGAIGFERGLTPSALYAEAIDAGFAPTVVCDTPEKFEDYALQSFGQVIRADFGAGVALIGWRYPEFPEGESPGYGTVTPRTLLAEAPGGERIVTLFNQPGLPAPDLGEAEGLSVYTARVGTVDVYEISPLGEPVVLGLLSGG